MDFHLPELGEGVYEAELVEWRVQPGDTVKRGQELAEVVTDKASMPLPAPFFGRVTELRAEPGDMLKIGEVILTFEPTIRGESKEAEPKETDGEAQLRREERPRSPASVRSRASEAIRREETSHSAASSRVSAAPTVRRMARQLGIDLAGVPGSGPGGRVLIDDLTAILRRGNGIAPPSAAPAEPAADYGAPGTRRKLIGIRRQIAEHMVAS